MPRLIDANKLRKDILDLPNCYNGFSDAYDKAYIIDVIDEQPTVNVCPYWDNESDYCALNKPSDAEPVTRCKDCKHREVQVDGMFRYEMCGIRNEIINLEGFCHMGERKEDAEE